MSRVHPLSHKGLTEYFRTQLQQEMDGDHQEETRWYLGNLLDRFSRSEQLFHYQQEELSIRPLALLYGDAQQCAEERERCLLLRQLGDQALFLGALFPEHYERKGIRRDYFIGMGGRLTTTSPIMHVSCAMCSPTWRSGLLTGWSWSPASAGDTGATARPR